MNIHNTEYTPNFVDRAAGSVDHALDAARRASDAAIDRVATKVHAARDVASPAVDRVTAPVDSVVRYTRETPVRALLMAAAAGAAAMAVTSFFRARRR